MGLAERRALAAYQEKKFPQWKSEIDATAGYAMPIEVDWNGLALDGKSAEYNEMFDYSFFFPLKKALASICADQMGKDALKAKVKSIKVVHSTSETYAVARLEGDVLVITAGCGYVASENWTDQSVTNISTELENKL
jgi:hypothetical protein